MSPIISDSSFLYILNMIDSIAMGGKPPSKPEYDPDGLRSCHAISRHRKF